MKSVNVLGDNSRKLSRLFKLCKLIVRLVRLFVKTEHFVTIKAEELACFVNKKCVAENLLGRIIVLLIVQTVLTKSLPSYF